MDNGNVKTSRELWAYMKSEDWNVDVRSQYTQFIYSFILMSYPLVSPVNTFVVSRCQLLTIIKASLSLRIVPSRYALTFNILSSLIKINV